MQRERLEEWRSVPGVDLPEHYQVSNLGRIRHTDYTDRRGWPRRKRFVHGHAGAVRFRQLNQDRIGKPRQW